MRGEERLYRYRTAAFHGPWRAGRAEAVRDAVEAGQAAFRPNGSGRILWRVEGRIESRRARPGEA